ncbi:MAG TPA: diacylglycerol kinase family protein [Candidatus Sulfotelmatobacter sp.]|jgi:diacylglycerol kinase (ATP)|nr:diacylglycerol kinase family protein [Candidatus Sulfotelmatobacter sp.]
MSKQQERFLAIVNPAAGGGKSAKLAGAALKQLRENGLAVDVIATTGRGHAVELAAEAYSQGYRRFLAVGGDGTAHEILNGLFGRAKAQERVSLGFLPLGTGNSFLRDFAKEGADASLRALLERRTRPVDLIRLTHSTGELYSLNILSIGFTADVGALTNRYFKSLGPLGYLLGVLVRVARLKRRSLTLRCDDDIEWDNRRSLFLTFNNSKYTGGNMLIAPDADSTDGYIEFVRWGPIGRLGLLRTLPRLYDGTHIHHPLASRRAVRHVEFNLPVPVDVLIDGEIETLECKSIDILPGAVDVYI